LLQWGSPCRSNWHVAIDRAAHGQLRRWTDGVQCGSPCCSGWYVTVEAASKMLGHRERMTAGVTALCSLRLPGRRSVTRNVGIRCCGTFRMDYRPILQSFLSLCTCAWPCMLPSQLLCTPCHTSEQHASRIQSSHPAYIQRLPASSLHKFINNTT
jgi:hypothetical protein